MSPTTSRLASDRDSLLTSCRSPSSNAWGRPAAAAEEGRVGTRVAARFHGVRGAADARNLVLGDQLDTHPLTALPDIEPEVHLVLLGRHVALCPLTR